MFKTEHFRRERFELPKNIILQLPSLQLKLLVCVTSGCCIGRLFDIAGRKIVNWFIPPRLLRKNNNLRHDGAWPW